MSHSPLEMRVRAIIAANFDRHHNSREGGNTTRELQIVAQPDGRVAAQAVTFLLAGTPVRGAITIVNIGYLNPVGADICSGRKATKRAVATLLEFLREVSGRPTHLIPPGYTWSSHRQVQISA